VAIPKYHEFMKPILLLFGDGTPLKRSDMYEKFAHQFHLTEEEKEKRLSRYEKNNKETIKEI